MIVNSMSEPSWFGRLFSALVVGSLCAVACLAALIMLYVRSNDQETFQNLVEQATERADCRAIIQLKNQRLILRELSAFAALRAAELDPDDLVARREATNELLAVDREIAEIRRLSSKERINRECR